MKLFTTAASLVAIVILAGATNVQASPEPGITIYHVGYDNAEFVGFGAYTGLPNPNYQRLTFLLSHTFEDQATSNHFHRIGAYSYTGDPMSPTPAFSGNNRVPEPYQGDDGLALLPGSGAFAGKRISGLGPVAHPEDEIELEYGDLTIAPIDELFQFDGQPDPDGEFPFHPGHLLLNASSGAYKGSIVDVTVELKLVDLSDGLSIHNQDGTPLFGAIDDVVTLGPGADWSINPVFAIDQGAPLHASYSASFVLTDLSASPLYGDSAPFSLDFVAAPEPGAAVLLALGWGLVALPRKR